LSLEAAEGWLGLGDHLAANEELEHITLETLNISTFYPHSLQMGHRPHSLSQAK
jgi:hypothetical protein